MLSGEHDAVDRHRPQSTLERGRGDENPNSCVPKSVRISQSVSRYFANDCL